MKLQEIKDCVDDGIPVYWKSEAYIVEKWSGDYVIVNQNNSHGIGLVWNDGVTLNGDEKDFYKKEDNHWTVWVGGTEVRDYLMTHEEARATYWDYVSLGYVDVRMEKLKDEGEVMEAYETDLMSHGEAMKFIRWFDKEIGTEYDLNEVSEGEWYIVFFDITWGEVKKIRKFENEMEK